MTLHECLSMYTMENVIQSFEPLYSAQMNNAKSRSELARKSLRQLGPDAAKYAVDLSESLEDQMYLREETAILAGIAVGLELGELIR